MSGQQTPEWAVRNVYMLARRRQLRLWNHGATREELDAWEHVVRLCEMAGARVDGVLRESSETPAEDR